MRAAAKHNQSVKLTIDSLSSWIDDGDVIAGTSPITKSNGT